MSIKNKRFTHDPNAVLDYHISWIGRDGLNDGSDSDDGWLQGDTITSSTWTAESGITVDSTANTTTTTTVWLSGGTDKKTYRVTNRIVTALGRTEDRTIIVAVKEK